MNGMLAKKEAAARHHVLAPIAHGPDANAESARDREVESRRQSETRMQAVVVAERSRDADDEYADVPCTD